MQWYDNWPLLAEDAIIDRGNKKLFCLAVTFPAWKRLPLWEAFACIMLYAISYISKANGPQKVVMWKDILQPGAS